MSIRSIAAKDLAFMLADADGAEVTIAGKTSSGIFDSSNAIVEGVLLKIDSVLVSRADFPDVSIDSHVVVDGRDYIVRDRATEGDGAAIKLILEVTK